MKNKVYISILLVLGLFLLSNLSWAQSKTLPNQPRYDKKKYHFGFYLGANQMHYSIRMKPGFTNFTYYQNQVPEINADSAYLRNVEPRPQLGFTIGIVSDLRLGKYFNLRFTPELMFSERKLNYTMLSYYRSIPQFVEIEKRVPSTHLNFPFYLKYKGVRLHNARPYVFIGVKFVMDLAAQAGKNEEDSNSQDVVIKLYRSDIAFEAGVGFDFYFNWFKMGTELRMSYGMKDILKKEDNIYSDPIESIHSKIFQLVFTFE